MAHSNPTYSNTCKSYPLWHKVNIKHSSEDVNTGYLVIHSLSFLGQDGTDFQSESPF